MIVRSYLRCLTCGKHHMVRIGLGQESEHTHKFPCSSCGEQIVLRLLADYTVPSTQIVCDENAELAEPAEDSTEVYLDANFVIPPGATGVEVNLARLEQIGELGEAALKAGRLGPIDAGVPYRRPDFANEWKQLHKVWSLSRSGMHDLAAKRLATASSALYVGDPLDDLDDWVWRFCSALCDPQYEKRVVEAMTLVTGIKEETRFRDMQNWLTASVMKRRGDLYFDQIKAFFRNYSEFAQVLFYINSGVAVPEGHIASSSDFDAVKMFYGNCFEAFTTLINLVAYVSNIVEGRPYSEFQSMNAVQYEKLDKASKCGPLQGKPVFAALCEEADNKLRNGSHHGAFVFDNKTQMITFKAGKGGQGDEVTLSYATYLSRCVRLFLQLLTLLRLELLIARELNIRAPV